VGVDDARAREHVVAALLEVPRDFAWLAGNVIAGRAAARLGDDAQVAEYRRRLLPWSGLLCWQGTCCYGPVDTVLAVLAAAAGDVAATRTHAGRARQLAGALGAPVFTRELDELGL
jgi:hypothetical protein